MAEQTAPEPTMEEILASIRRIISDDDAPIADTPSSLQEDGEWSQPLASATLAAATTTLAVSSDPVDAASKADEDDVLDLTEPAPAATVAAESPPPPATEAPAMTPSYSAPSDNSVEPLVSEPAAAAAASSFGRLSAAAARPPSMAMPAPGRTLEDVTRDLLRPMLKAWLDENLGAIVQQRVDEEVQRIARGRVR